MSSATLYCRSDQSRRSAVRNADLNGIDSLEVDCAQTTLIITFLGRAPEWIEPGNIRIVGGRRERDIRVLSIAIERAEDEALDDRLFVTVDRPGDFSNYRLEIVERDERGHLTGTPPKDFDARYASAEFNFKAACPQHQDPADCPPCPTEPAVPVAIDYLARDYQSFRKLILDRIALTMPDWKERHAPDIGVTLVELLAFVADDLSYYQDAVATEAFLDSARLRESLRRHCRLVDYRLHEGCSARTWAAFELHGAESVSIAAGDVMLTTVLPGEHGPMVRLEEIAAIPANLYLVFESWAQPPAIELRKARNRIEFYTWGGSDCCLLKGATSATLVDPGEAVESEQQSQAGDGDKPVPKSGRRTKKGPAPAKYEPEIEPGPSETKRVHALALKPGDVLIFAEAIGPRTGSQSDADPSRRHAVRLTSAESSVDPLTGQLIVEIQWCPEDALPFPLCLSARSEAPDCEWHEGISVAFGNIVAVDHGRSVDQELQPPRVSRVASECDDRCDPGETRYEIRRYRPSLDWPDVTFVAPPSLADQRCGSCGGTAASDYARPDPVAALPAVRLTSALAPEPDSRRNGDGVSAAEETRWEPRADLLASNPNDAHFVVEVAEDGTARLRFGDGVYGRAPAPGEQFWARYRVGSGPSGNIGAGALRHLVFRSNFPVGVTIGVTNPLPARGGTAAEPMANAKLRAPNQFRSRLERAVAPTDYAAIVMRDFPALVQRASAAMRASGVRSEVQVAIDALGTADPPQSLLDCIANHLENYRRIGHDVRVLAARKVPIDLQLRVCVGAGHIVEQVETEVREALGPGLDRKGQPGLFNPDAFSFGEGLKLSRILSRVHRVDGVMHVEVTRLQRLFEGPDGEIESGVLPLGPLEIARLDQDRDAPENGKLEILLEIER